MMRPVFLMSVVVWRTVTVASCVPAGRVLGVTSKPCVAVRVMSPVSLAAETVKVSLAPVPLMVNASVLVAMVANGGA